MSEAPAMPKRFVALDVHKQYVMVAAVDRERRVVLPRRRVTFDRFDGWSGEHLRPSDAVVLEATTNAWLWESASLTLTLCQIALATPYSGRRWPMLKQ